MSTTRKYFAFKDDRDPAKWGVEERTDGSLTGSVMYDVEFDRKTAQLMARLLNEGKGMDAWAEDPPDWDRETVGVPDFLYDRMIEAGWKDPMLPEGTDPPAVRIPGFGDQVVEVPYDRWLAITAELKAHRDELAGVQKRIAQVLGELSDYGPLVPNPDGTPRHPKLKNK